MKFTITCESSTDLSIGNPACNIYEYLNHNYGCSNIKIEKK